MKCSSSYLHIRLAAALFCTWEVLRRGLLSAERKPFSRRRPAEKQLVRFHPCPVDPPGRVWHSPEGGHLPCLVVSSASNQPFQWRRISEETLYYYRGRFTGNEVCWAFAASHKESCRLPGSLLIDPSHGPSFKTFRRKPIGSSRKTERRGRKMLVATIGRTNIPKLRSTGPVFRGNPFPKSVTTVQQTSLCGLLKFSRNSSNSSWRLTRSFQVSKKAHPNHAGCLLSLLKHPKMFIQFEQMTLMIHQSFKEAYPVGAGCRTEPSKLQKGSLKSPVGLSIRSRATPKNCRRSRWTVCCSDNLRALSPVSEETKDAALSVSAVSQLSGAGCHALPISSMAEQTVTARRKQFQPVGYR